MQPPRCAFAALVACTMVLSVLRAGAQGGRPALPAETAEDARVKQALRDALPHALPRWTVESESNLDGVTGFHNGSQAVTEPFTHQFKISYAYQPTDAERAKWQAAPATAAAIQQMLEETSCEVTVDVNRFEQAIDAAAPADTRVRPPFAQAVSDAHGAWLLLGPWALGAPERGDATVSYRATAARNRSVPASQIQTVVLAITGSPRVVDFVLAHTDVAALAAMVGQNRMAAPARTGPASPERPLAAPAPGENLVTFTLDGGEFRQRTIRLKPSAQGQFGYLNNFYPDPAVTENAVTRVLAAEDDDFTTKTKTGFLDMTMPLVRQTGTFEVTPDNPKTTLDGGVNCWDGCEWSFGAQKLTVTVTRYDPVNGFIEGTFSGTVTLKYKASEPVDHRETTATLTAGAFRVRRRADRY
jgi:hypothetical protein